MKRDSKLIVINQPIVETEILSYLEIGHVESEIQRLDSEIKSRMDCRSKLVNKLKTGGTSRSRTSRSVSAGVKLPNCAELKFLSLWVVAGHYDLLNFTPLRMLSVWFQLTEVSDVITWERLFMLHELHAQGVSISAIARQTGLDRKTVRRHLAAGIQPPVYGPRAPQGSLLGRFTVYLQARLDQYPGLSGSRLLREIQAQGYTGGYTILTDYLRTIRPPQEAGYEVRFETPAGHQGQIDFAHFKVNFRCDPQVARVVWLFSLVLGHSRYLFGRFAWGYYQLFGELPSETKGSIYRIKY